MGQTQTSAHPSAKFALPLSTDIVTVARHVHGGHAGADLAINERTATGL